jgi:aminoglycoside/choline kinase family phosphotransferase
MASLKQSAKGAIVLSDMGDDAVVATDNEKIHHMTIRKARVIIDIAYSVPKTPQSLDLVMYKTTVQPFARYVLSILPKM